MRLTAEILSRADNYINPVKEREINLRGLKLAAIENISVLQDQYDAIDFSDNEIKKLDNFPKMKRLCTILINNNYISKINLIGEQCPNIKTLILTNNRISHLIEIDHIASCSKLEILSLIDNIITSREHYRKYVIFKIPSLKLLDFRKVRKAEREEAAQFFSTPVGQEVLTYISQETLTRNNDGRKEALSEEQKKQIREAIATAASPDEMDRIERQLRAGTFPFTKPSIGSGPLAVTASPSGASPIVTESDMTVQGSAEEDKGQEKEKKEKTEKSEGMKIIDTDEMEVVE